MGKKIFVTYKYSDNNVYSLNRYATALLGTGLSGMGIGQSTTVRHYVDQLQNILEREDHINKGENDGEDLNHFKNDTIASRLRDKIYDSSITIVMISPGMKEVYTPESDQWIPWEIAYSLREHTRGDRTSRSNAVLAIVLPDRQNSYGYFIQEKNCCQSGCQIFQLPTLFQILRENMFNARRLTPMACSGNLQIFTGNHSYIISVKWCDFKSNVNYYLDAALRINQNISEYEIVKSI